jgi:hypothetical protein
MISENSTTWGSIFTVVEPLLETIILDVDESNELLFRVKIEGIDPAPAKVRLVCEAGDVAYMFNGHPMGDDTIQFLLPVLKGKLKEGTYLSRVEVLVQDKFFAPVSFNIDLKQTVTVVAEAVKLPMRKPVPQVTVTASAPVVVAKPAPTPPPPPPAPKPVVETAKPVAKKPVPPVKASSLRDRYNKKRLVERTEPVVEVGDDAGEDLIRELAQTFVRGRPKK